MNDISDDVAINIFTIIVHSTTEAHAVHTQNLLFVIVS